MWLWLNKTSLRISLATLGPWAIVVLGLSAAVYQPLGPDLFVVVSTSVGLSPWLAALLAVFSTAGGGVLGYAIGRGLFGSIFKRILERKEQAIRKAEDWLSRRGLWVIAIAGISPIPLTQVTWAAGLLRMNFAIFVGGLFLGLVPRFLLEALFSNLIQCWFSHFPG
ncbi:MAG: hypothetical protein DRP89_09015 [Candidatus Neomarinimicrobiota bacterium]|nr:MAG: hypothetical protein DRP89_09015 [Candidatus Neomarinimicrobiota bacterium]